MQNIGRDAAGTCCFLGQSFEKFFEGQGENNSAYMSLLIKIVLEIESKMDKGCDTFLTPLCCNAEIWFAEAVLDLRRAYPDKHLRLISILPAKEDCSAGPASRRAQHIVPLSDEVVTLDISRAADYMQTCVGYMLAHAGHLIVVRDERNAGAHAVAEEACKKGLETTVITSKGDRKDTITVRHLTILH